ncbi:MAG: helix-turn-helix transcriptional regulator [Clostridiaceae bacterium]|nr:helix-turn-helix transcriptional regulator [Clostridiaceae bacterium]
MRKFRKEKGNTQEDLANHLNISVQAVSKWERGERNPDIALLPATASITEKPLTSF